MFELTKEEFDLLRSQFVTSKGRGGIRYLPFAFTEQGVAMLSQLDVINIALADLQSSRMKVTGRRRIGFNTEDL